MVKMIVTCDEKWPIYDLRCHWEGQEANCEIPEDLYRDYLLVMLKYEKMQKILKEFHDQYQREVSEKSCGRCIPEYCKVEHHTFNRISSIKAS